MLYWRNDKEDLNLNNFFVLDINYFTNLLICVSWKRIFKFVKEKKGVIQKLLRLIGNTDNFRIFLRYNESIITG